MPTCDERWAAYLAETDPTEKARLHDEYTLHCGSDPVGGGGPTTPTPTPVEP